MQLLHNLVDETLHHHSDSAEQQAQTIALSMARQTAVPQGQVLSNEEMENLVNELFSCSNVNYTPDGRSILAILPQHDIEKLLDK